MVILFFYPVLASSVTACHKPERLHLVCMMIKYHIAQVGDMTALKAFSM